MEYEGGPAVEDWVKLGDLVIVQWRDSFADHGESNLDDHKRDCRWYSVGWVIRKTPLFITIAGGIQETKVGGERTADNLLSIPWTQVIDWETVA